MNKKEEILKSLEPLFEKAKKEKLFFFCYYQNLWFTPKELRQHHKEGTFIWEKANWELRNPKEETIRLKRLILNLEMKLKEWESKILEC